MASTIVAVWLMPCVCVPCGVCVNGGMEWVVVGVAWCGQHTARLGVCGGACGVCVCGSGACTKSRVSVRAVVAQERWWWWWEGRRV